jgi:hypothetical protein
VEGPPDDPSREKENELELQVLQGSTKQPAHLEELVQAARFLYDDSADQYRSDLADQLRRLRDDSLRPLDLSDPRWSELVEVATGLVKAGFRIDDCYVAGHLGGACLLPMPEGVIVRWSQHELSGYQYDHPDYQKIQHIMGDAMAQVIRVLGFRVTPSEFPGSYLITRRRQQ